MEFIYNIACMAKFIFFDGFHMVFKELKSKLFGRQGHVI